MVELVMYAYMASALVVLVTALYCLRRDDTARAACAGDVFGPALFPVFNTFVAVFCAYILWSDFRAATPTQPTKEGESR